MKATPSTEFSPQTLESAQAFIASNYRCTLRVELAGLADAQDRILVEDVAAPFALPRFPASAMDGFAVRDADFPASQPTLLRVVGVAKAGHPYSSPLEPGQAVRIYTGAAVPAGADRVIMQEDCQIGNGTVACDLVGKRKTHIRQPGEDVRLGQTLFKKGERLSAAHLALLSALRFEQIKVRARLKVALVSTGDELRRAGDIPGPAQIIDTNGPYLKRLLLRFGCDVEDMGIVTDDADTLLATLVRAASNNDLIITSGGASVGAEDHLKSLIGRRGFLEFWRLRMKPGKPVGLGDIDDCPILALPGNPVAAAVTFKFLVEPLMARLAGDIRRRPVALRLPLLSPVKKSTGKLEVLAARLSEDLNGRSAVEILDTQGSASLLALARVEGWALVPQAEGSISQGTFVDYCPAGPF